MKLLAVKLQCTLKNSDQVMVRHTWRSCSGLDQSTLALMVTKLKRSLTKQVQAILGNLNFRSWLQNLARLRISR